MSEDIRKMIDKVKNFKTFVNENHQLDQISNAVKLLTKKYNVEYGVSCDLINQGDCENFAEELYDYLKEIGITGEILSDGLFYDPFEDEPDDMMLNASEYGNKPNDFDKVGLPSHYWFYYNGKHYDSDAPNGVNDMFELPIIKNFYLKKRG
jgi:hypothetical protein